MDEKTLANRQNRNPVMQRIFGREGAAALASVALLAPASGAQAQSATTEVVGAPSTIPSPGDTTQGQLDSEEDTDSTAQNDSILRTTPVFSVRALAKTDRVKQAKAKKRCDRQLELDPRQFSSCQYPGAYAGVNKANPKWIAKHKLEPTDKDDLDARKKLYFKTHPKEYKKEINEIQAGKYYISPIHFEVWRYVNSHECGSAFHPDGFGTAPPYWNCKIGNGYDGGLQQNVTFQKQYNYLAYQLWGSAANWPIGAQELGADRAYVGYANWEARGLGPWPSSKAAYGKFPVKTFKVKINTKARGKRIEEAYGHHIFVR